MPIEYSETKSGTFVIEAAGLSKVFALQRRTETAVKLLRRAWGSRGRSSTHFSALDNISLRVTRGDRIGLIGDNGAGKSTLLRLVAGLYRPDQGTISVAVPVSLVTGFGVGMLDELSVRDNIVLYGALYGVDRRRTVAHIDDILVWAELSEFSGAKLGVLSTGMRARLAFSVARFIERDIQLFDEALAAGDRHFREKCYAVFEEYKSTDKTFIVATHNLDFVRSFCNRALWLDKGKQMSFGEPESVIAFYKQSRANSGGETAP